MEPHMKRLKTHLPVKRTDLTNIKNQPYHVLSQVSRFCRKKKLQTFVKNVNLARKK